MDGGLRMSKIPLEKLFLISLEIPLIVFTDEKFPRLHQILFDANFHWYFYSGLLFTLLRREQRFSESIVVLHRRIGGPHPWRSYRGIQTLRFAGA